MSRVQVDNQMTKVLVLVPNQTYLLRQIKETPPEFRFVHETPDDFTRFTDSRTGWTYAIKTPQTTAEQDELIEGKRK